MSRLTSVGLWFVADPRRVALVVTAFLTLIMIAGLVITLAAGVPTYFAGPTGGGGGGGG